MKVRSKCNIYQPKKKSHQQKKSAHISAINSTEIVTICILFSLFSGSTTAGHLLLMSNHLPKDLVTQSFDYQIESCSSILLISISLEKLCYLKTISLFHFRNYSMNVITYMLLVQPRRSRSLTSRGLTTNQTAMYSISKASISPIVIYFHNKSGWTWTGMYNTTQHQRLPLVIAVNQMRTKWNNFFW